MTGAEREATRASLDAWEKRSTANLARHEALEQRVADLEVALKPFARCAEELDGNEDVPRAPDGEWAKFRLLTDDYRRARAALTPPTPKDGQ